MDGRSLAATVGIKLKARGRGLNPKLRKPENSWLQETLIDKSSSKSLHTYTETKLHPQINKFQSMTYHDNSPAIQEHNTEN